MKYAFEKYEAKNDKNQQIINYLIPLEKLRLRTLFWPLLECTMIKSTDY